MTNIIFNTSRCCHHLLSFAYSSSLSFALICHIHTYYQFCYILTFYCVATIAICILIFAAIHCRAYIQPPSLSLPQMTPFWNTICRHCVHKYLIHHCPHRPLYLLHRLYWWVPDKTFSFIHQYTNTYPVYFPEKRGVPEYVVFWLFKEVKRPT